ncbi:Tumour protein p53-inducible nuclear protein [Cinara cedri]|uniref:Tumour protein p53-inducible nuclear protein n=2 Tax=Cinara cedri TaxID=506608 RepID=A0A5E4NEV6_9HEMI|nr:Tumour protein p53-inducible nuclear protein [Cinara cedri]
MFSNLSSWFYGSSTVEKIDEPVTTIEPCPDSLIEIDENFEPVDIDEADDWVILGKGDSESESKKTDDEGCGCIADRHSRSSSSCQNEEGWFVTPPPCFTSVGPADMETTPLENLLIEHPSMSVYHSATVSSVLPEKRTLASIASYNESFDDDTPIIFDAVKTKEKLPKQPKKKTLKKSVPLDEFKIAPEIILGDVPSVLSPAVFEVKKVERSPTEMFPVLAPISKPKVCSPPANRSYKEVVASLKRRQPKNDMSETKHVKIESKIEVVDSPIIVSPLEKTQTAVKVSMPTKVMKKGRKPPCPLPHIMKNESQKMPKEIIVPKMRAQERLVRLSSFSVIQSDVPKSCKTPKRNTIKNVEKQKNNLISDSIISVETQKTISVVDTEDKKKKKVQQKSIVKETKVEKNESHPVTQTVVARPKCDIIPEKRDQKSPVKKENIIIPLTTSIALNSLVSRPEENAYKHEMLKRELAMIAGTNKAQKLQAHRETRILCRNQLAHINRVNLMLSASNKRLRRADKNMRPSGANNNRKCC